jgi:5'-nucleotidase
MEGAHWGVPAIALSHCASDEALLQRLRPELPGLLERLIPAARALGGALNVNLPPATGLPYAGLRVTRLGARHYANEVYQRNDPRGQLYFWIGGDRVFMPDLPGSDCNAVRDGWVSVTPLADDLTRRGAMAPLAAALAVDAPEPTDHDLLPRPAGPAEPA